MNIKKMVKIAIIPIAVMMMGYILLVISCLIPKWVIQNEIKESADILYDQGKIITGPINGFFVDNWTDSDCLSICYNRSSNNPLYNALNAFQVGRSDVENGVYSVQALKAAAEDDWDSIGDHSYLWHGYRIWLNMLLIKYNIEEIRVFLILITNICIVFLCIYLSKVSNNFLISVPFLFSILFFNLQLEAISLLFFNDIIITIIGCAAVIWMSNNDKEVFLPEVFTLIGAILAFSSMLMLPILTLGFPLIMLLLFSTNGTWRFNLRRTIFYSINWLWGYAVTLGSKILMSLFLIRTGDTGKTRVLAYSGVGSFDLKMRFEMAKSVLSQAIFTSEIKRDLLLVVLCVLIIISLINRRICFNDSTFASLALIMFYPAIWCFFMPAHSGHGWTCWNYSISIFAIFTIIWNWNFVNNKQKTETKNG